MGLAETIEGPSVVSGASLLVQVVWDELELLGAGAMVGMGFPNFMCSLKTWNRPMSPLGPPAGLIDLPQGKDRIPCWASQGWQPVEVREGGPVLVPRDPTDSPVPVIPLPVSRAPIPLEGPP